MFTVRMYVHTHTHKYLYVQVTDTRCREYILLLRERCTATRCGVQQHTAIHYISLPRLCRAKRTATLCNILQHTALYCNTLQHTATHHTASHLQHTATVEGSVSGYIIPLHALQKLQKHIVLFRLVCKLKEALEIEREPLCREYIPVEKDTCRAGCTATLCDVLQYIATLQHEDALNTLSWNRVSTELRDKTYPLWNIHSQMHTAARRNSLQ